MKNIKKYLSKKTLYKIGKMHNGDESKYWDFRTMDRSIEELVLLREKAFEKDKVIVKIRYVAGEKIGRIRFTFTMNGDHWKIDN